MHEGRQLELRGKAKHELQTWLLNRHGLDPGVGKFPFGILAQPARGKAEGAIRWAGPSSDVERGESMLRYAAMPGMQELPF